MRKRKYIVQGRAQFTFDTMNDTRFANLFVGNEMETAFEKAEADGWTAGMLRGAEVRCTLEIIKLKGEK